MRILLRIFTVFFLLLVAVSCVQSPLPFSSNYLVLTQTNDGVTITAKSTLLGIEMAFTQKGVPSVPEANENLLLIHDPDAALARYSFTNPGGTIEKNTELLFLPGKKISDIVFKKVETIDTITDSRATAPYLTGFSLKNDAVDIYETFVLEIYGKSITNLGGFELWIEYDPALLQVNTSTGNTVALVGPCASGLMLTPVYYEGQIKITAAFTGGVTIGSTAAAVLQIQFQAKGAAGSAYVRFGSSTVVSNTSAAVMSVGLHDGTITVSDSDGPVLLGDFNEDLIVDLLDFVAFANHYGTSSSSSSRAYDVLYDIAPAEDRYDGVWAGIYDTCTPDGVINLLDFVVFGMNYGKSEPSETNENPSAPTSPVPTNGSTGISTTPTLSWNPSSDPDGDPITYDLYMDTATDPTTLLTPTSLSVTQYSATGLSQSTRYYWKVVAKDNRGGTSTGGPWYFTTQAPANHAPTAPTNPTPANNSTSIPVNTTLSWTASTDSDSGDVISYDLYWDTFSNPTTLRGSNLSAANYSVTNLSNGTKYYWKVIAKDNQGASTSSAVWNFTTVVLPSAPQYRALTVGLTTYDDGGNLDSPDNDSLDIQQMLSHLSEEYVTTVQTGRITKTQLNTLLNGYASGSASSDVFLFHYSGHGWYTGGQSNLYMSDGQSVSVTELRTKLSAINGTKIVLIDACESGSFVNLIEGREVSLEEKLERIRLFNENVIDVFSQPSENRGSYDSPCEYYVLTGSAIDEYSNEDSYLNNGFMTFFFNDGFGDVGSNNPTAAFDYTYNADGYGSGGSVDTEITFKEIYLYTRDKVQTYISSEYGEVQTVQGTPTSSTWVVGTYSGGSSNNPPSTPSNPTPANGSTDINQNQILSWYSSGATAYDVYFGTTTSPSKVSSNQTTALYDPGTLTESTTYYWKIVAKNAYGSATGAVWSFTTQDGSSEDGARVILRSPTPEIVGNIEFDYTNAFYDYQYTSPPHWKANVNGTLTFTFTGKTTFYFNAYGVPSYGYPAVVEGYVNGEYIGYASLSQSWETWYIDTEAMSTGENVVVLSVYNGTFWIDEGWVEEAGEPIQNPPSTPANPSPADGAGSVSTTPTLTWSCLNATSYNVYFGTQSTPPLASSGITTASYSPSGTLSAGTTYYWKIVGINEYGSTTGPVWSFVVQSGTGDGIDFTGPTYTGDTLLVSNESVNGNTSAYTGSLSATRMPLIKERYERGVPIEREAYRLNPKLPFKEADPMLLVRPETAGAVPRAVGDTRQFTVYNFRTDSDQQITATLQAIGTRTYVWAESTTDITTARAQQLASEFDGQIYSSVTTNFYTPSDVNGDGKIAILCFDIQDDFETTGGYVGGYFWARDLYNQSGSNLMEIFYIDTYPTMHYPSTNPIDVTEAYSTLAHEFQHMVNYNRNVLVEGGDDMDTWLDEGLSMAAEHLIYGTLTSRINYYNSASGIRNGHSVLYWDDAGDTLCNYSLSYLFLQYVRVQMNQGNAIFKEILEDSVNDYRAVENAAKDHIGAGMTFGDFMTNFRLALFLKNATGSYGFKGESGFNTIDTKMYTGTGTNIRGGGAVFKAISGAFTDPGNAGASIQFAGIS
jgi:hypothetical protein